MSTLQFFVSSFCHSKKDEGERRRKNVAEGSRNQRSHFHFHPSSFLLFLEMQQSQLSTYTAPYVAASTPSYHAPEPYASLPSAYPASTYTSSTYPPAPTYGYTSSSSSYGI